MVCSTMISILLPNRCEERVHDVIETLERIIPDCEILIAVDREGRGKGWAVRKALKHARGSVIAFLDADMDIAPRMLLRLIPFLYDYDIVVGTKGLTGIPSRKILTWLSRWYIRILFGLSVESQSGVKLFKRSHLPEWETDGYAFDIEILAKAQKNGSRMIEVPIEAVHSKKMAAKSVFNTLKESIKIWLELNTR